MGRTRGTRPALRQSAFGPLIAAALLCAAAAPAVASHDSGKHKSRDRGRAENPSDVNREAAEDKSRDGRSSRAGGADPSAGGSGTQGRSDSDPDGDTNGGADKPGGTDGDRDGNNGCGNDTDFDDDNNGWCGGRDVDELRLIEAILPGHETSVLGARSRRPAAIARDAGASRPTSEPTEVMGARYLAPASVPRGTTPMTAAGGSNVLGLALPATGTPVALALLAAVALVAIGLGTRKASS